MAPRSRIERVDDGFDYMSVNGDYRSLACHVPRFQCLRAQPTASTMRQPSHESPPSMVEYKIYFMVPCAGRADLFELASEVLPKILTHSRSELLAKCDV